MFKIILIVSFICICLADQRLNVTAHIESQCPDCINLIKNSIQKILSIDDIGKVLNLIFVPYGNANYVIHDDGSYGFTCQHGSIECHGNLLEVCALNHIQGLHQQVDFMVCLEDARKSTSAQFDAESQACSQSYPGLYEKIQICAKGPEGQKLQYEAAVQTEKLSPPHTYVPWITVNGEHDINSENEIIADILKWTCTNYKGETVIEKCRDY